MSSQPPFYFGAMRQQGVEKTRTADILNRLQEDIKSKENTLQSRIQEITKTLSSVSAIDKNNYNSTKANILIGVNVATAAMSFIPLVGPAWTAIIGPIINGAITGSINNTGTTDRKMLAGIVGGLNAAVKMSFTMDDAKQSSWSIGGVASNATYVDDPFRNKIMSAAITSELSPLSLALTQPINAYLTRPQSGKSNVIIPVTEKAAGLETKNCASAIIGGYSWVNDLSSRSSLGNVLIYVAIYTYLNGISSGGRGSSIVDTGYGYIDQIDDKLGATYKKLGEFKDSAERIANTGSFGHKSSRLTTMLGKYSLDSGTQRSSGYMKMIGRSSAPNSDNVNAAAESLETTIALEKARIIAYADDYFTSLKGVFGNTTVQNLTSTLTTARKLPSAFKDSGHGIKLPYKKATRLDADRSTHRKDFAIAIYAFHSIILRHLGTWNLSALLPFGCNEALDMRAHNALLDAAITHFWICSESYKTIGLGIGSTTITVNEQLYTDNSIISYIESMPYIYHYFDSKRYWEYQGKKIRIDRSSLSDIDKTDLSKEMQDALNGADIYENDFDKVITNTIIDAFIKIREDYIKKYTFSKYFDALNSNSNDFNDRFIKSITPTSKEISGLASFVSRDLDRIYNTTKPKDKDEIKKYLKSGWDSVDQDIGEITKVETITDKYSAFLAKQSPDLAPHDAPSTIKDRWSNQLANSKGMNSLSSSAKQTNQGVAAALSRIDMQTRMVSSGETLDQSTFCADVLVVLNHLLSKK
jgi:hypothetical protein